MIYNFCNETEVKFEFEYEKIYREVVDWATEALEEMDDFIESQGIYIRQ